MTNKTTLVQIVYLCIMNVGEKNMTKKKRFDGELLFKTWCEWGIAATHNRLIEFARSQYGSASQMGPYYASWHWAFENPEKAFEYWKDWYFQNYPDLDPTTFEDFLLILKDKGKNPNVAHARKLERFCAKYNLDMEYRVAEDDIIQVTKRDSHLYQKLLFVEGIEGKFISAYFLFPDGTRSNHELKSGEFGVIGRSIV